MFVVGLQIQKCRLSYKIYSLKKMITVNNLPFVSGTQVLLRARPPACWDSAVHYCEACVEPYREVQA